MFTSLISCNLRSGYSWSWVVTLSPGSLFLLPQVGGAVAPRGSGGGYRCSWVLLLRLHLDKMAVIFQTFSNAFSWMKMYLFRLRFHWSLFPRVHWTIFQTLVQIMACRLDSAKPLSEPMVDICVTRPLWVQKRNRYCKICLLLLILVKSCWNEVFTISSSIFSQLSLFWRYIL